MASSEKGSLSSALKKIYSMLSLDGKDISAIYLFAILGGLVQLTLPIGIQTIINFVQAGSISTSIIVLIIFVVAGTFINGLLQVRQMQYTEKIQQKIYIRYSFAFVDTLPKLDIQKLDKYYLPELVNRFFDTTTFQKGIAKLLLDIPTATIQIVFGLILLSFYHPVFIVFGITLAFLLFLILKLTANEGFTTSMQESDYKYKTAAWIEEMARAIKTFKYAKDNDLHLKVNDQLTGKYIESRTAHFKILQTQYWSLISFKIIITAGMLIVGAFLLVDQQLNIGQFIAAEIVILSVISSVEKFITSLDVVYDTITASEKLHKITNSALEQEGSLVLPAKSEGVEIAFQNVTFSYNNEENVINNLTLELPKNSCTAIMGLSGSGKSTLLRMLTGAFHQLDGRVLVDDVPIDNYTISSLRNNAGVLLSNQDIFLGSVMDNITMGDSAISIDHITSLAKELGFLGSFQQYPNGFDTMLDSEGKKLSRKEVKKILLLRALVGQQRLLLLEEPFNDLDPEQVKNVVNYISKLQHTTTVFTTTNIKVCQSFNRIVWIEKGTAVAIGNWSTIEPFTK